MEADTLLANTPQKDTFASSVASIGLQWCPADHANQMEVSNSHWTIILYTWKRAVTIEFVGQDILGLKIPAHDYYSDDDILAHSNSDPNILATVEKANFVEFLDNDS